MSGNVEASKMSDGVNLLPKLANLRSVVKVFAKGEKDEDEVKWRKEENLASCVYVYLSFHLWRWNEDILFYFLHMISFFSLYIYVPKSR